MDKHEERLSRNPRIGMVYRNWQKQEPLQRQAILNRAQWCLDNIEIL
jgi:deoxyribodipyrimidine photolyase-related protein